MPTGRNKRQAAMNAMEDVHNLKLNKDKPKKDSKGDDSDDFIAPTKDKSIKAEKIFEFQFYPDFERLQDLNNKI
jgi:hypothetical protein